MKQAQAGKYSFSFITKALCLMDSFLTHQKDVILCRSSLEAEW